MPVAFPTHISIHVCQTSRPRPSSPRALTTHLLSTCAAGAHQSVTQEGGGLERSIAHPDRLLMPQETWWLRALSVWLGRGQWHLALSEYSKPPMSVVHQRSYWRRLIAAAWRTGQMGNTIDRRTISIQQETFGECKLSAASCRCFDQANSSALLIVSCADWQGIGCRVMILCFVKGLFNSSNTSVMHEFQNWTRLSSVKISIVLILSDPHPLSSPCLRFFASLVSNSYAGCCIYDYAGMEKTTCTGFAYLHVVVLGARHGKMSHVDMKKSKPAALE